MTVKRSVKGETYQIPVPDEIRPEISPEKKKSYTVDLRSDSVLDQESSLLTTFGTPFGRYRIWCRLPFGLTVS